MKVSNCCGAKDRQMNVHGVEYSDLELCPACKEPCEFEEKDPDCFIEQYGLKRDFNDFTFTNGGFMYKSTLDEACKQTQNSDSLKTHATFRVYLKKQSA